MLRKIILKVYTTVRDIIIALGLWHRFSIIRKIMAVVVRNLKQDFSTIPILLNGHIMFLDKNDALQLSIKKYEPTTTKIFEKYIAEGDTVLDIGANIGYFTLLAGKLVEKTGQVFAFEPDPDNFSILCQNINLNNYENIVLIEKAVTEQSGKIKLYRSGRTGDHRIFDSGDNREAIEINALRLDDYLKTPIDFIKIDIQGSEYGALKGMTNLISVSPHLKILIEYQTSMLRKAGTDPHLVIDFLLEQGFVIYIIVERKLMMKIADTDWLKNHDYNGNLFCLKKLSTSRPLG